MSLDLKNDMYNKALREDILSVVDTTMIPYGIDCEAYDIVGIIEDYAVIKNRLSGFWSRCRPRRQPVLHRLKAGSGRWNNKLVTGHTMAALRQTQGF